MANDSATGAKKETPPVIPHVLHVVDRGVYARFGRMFRQLGIALSDEGIRVSLLTDDAEAAAELDGTPIADRFFRPLRGWGVWRLHGYLRREFDPPPDIVHVWSTTALGFLSEWTLQSGTSLLIHTTSLDDFALLSRRGVRDNEILLAACDEYARQLRKRWPGRADTVRVFKPALLFPEKKTECSATDRTLGILWTGRMDKHSGLDVLIEAAEILLAKQADIQIGLIGRGPDSRYYLARNPPPWRAKIFLDHRRAQSLGSGHGRRGHFRRAHPPARTRLGPPVGDGPGKGRRRLTRPDRRMVYRG